MISPLKVAESTIGLLDLFESIPELGGGSMVGSASVGTGDSIGASDGLAVERSEPTASADSVTTSRRGPRATLWVLELQLDMRQ